MSPPTSDVTNGGLSPLPTPAELNAPARLPSSPVSGDSALPVPVGTSLPLPIQKQQQQQITGNAPVHKRSPNDFIFGKIIGDGSFSTVYLAKDIHTSREYAIKVCEKRHIIKEKKVEYVKREKEVLNMLLGARHSFVKLFCTFQDVDRLYFVLSYAKNGELLPYINKVGSFDIECTKFYSAEILRGLEYLHGLGVIHRDLKPENILLDDKMHILITDFGSAKILSEEETDQQKQLQQDGTEELEGTPRRRRNSFVGTAQYVSPELLINKTTSRASDLWALGCIMYQMISGLPPFRGRSEYLIFKQILALNYELPDGFCEQARDLVSRLLVIEPSQRLGASDEHGAGYPSIRAHPLFAGVDFETLHEQTPPPIYPYLPGTSEHEELRSQYRVPDHLEPGLDDKQLTRLLGLGIGEPSSDDDEEEQQQQQQQQQAQREREEQLRRRREERRELQRCIRANKPKNKYNLAKLLDNELSRRLEDQKADNQWNSFVNGNLIVKQGFVSKRKGLFARRRMLLLTTGPHLYYVDPVSMSFKGEIPWSKELRVEPKNFKIFFVHTPNRTYYLEDPEGFALDWCQAIEETRIHYYGVKESLSQSQTQQQ